jgi:hypothetical protein
MGSGIFPSIVLSRNNTFEPIVLSRHRLRQGPSQMTGMTPGLLLVFAVLVLLLVGRGVRR